MPFFMLPILQKDITQELSFSRPKNQSILLRIATGNHCPQELSYGEDLEVKSRIGP